MKNIVMVLAALLAASAIINVGTVSAYTSEDGTARVQQRSETVFAGSLTNESALAFDKRIVFETRAKGINKLSAVVTYDSSTFSNATFTDGKYSTGTITVISTTALLGTHVTVDGILFHFGNDGTYQQANHVLVAVGASVGASADNLLTAIKANAHLSPIVTGSSSTGVISLTSVKADGVEYSLASTKPTVVSVDASGEMGGGVATTLNAATDKVTLLSHGMGTGIKVLYSGTPAIAGLTTGTTYFAIRTDANSVKLASSLVNAISGTAVDITGQLVGDTAHTYTLAPLAIAGTPSFKWGYSNDNSTFMDLAVASVTMDFSVAGGTTTVWDFGVFNFGFISLDIIAPTAGGISVDAVMNAKR